MKRILTIAIAALLTAGPAAVTAQQAATSASTTNAADIQVVSPASRIPARIDVDAVKTRHRGRFNQQDVAYDAFVEQQHFVGDDGVRQATLITTSYVRTNAPKTQRPVLFMFNGGPGASTTPLHFDAFGPWLRVGPDKGKYLVPNVHSPLDAIDLVYVDPVGTGFSRAHVDEHAFWTLQGDARAVAQVIQQWLKRHGRDGAPTYVLGQSYGTARAPQVLLEMPELKVAGVALLALFDGAVDPLFGHMGLLPSYAAAAHHHGKGDYTALPVEDVYRQAVDFARGPYLQALVRGGSLSQASRRDIARQVAAFTGLPAAFVEAQDLRIDREDFYLNVLKASGVRTGMLDARATRSLDAPAARPPLDDPGLSYSPEGSKMPPAPAGVIRDTEAASVVERYYREVLGFKTPERHIGLNMDVHAAFHKGGLMNELAAAGALRKLGQRMQDDANLRLYWGAGLYDLTTPAFYGRFALDQAGIPAAQVIDSYYASGHSVYVEEVNRKRIADEMRAFTNAATNTNPTAN